MKKYKVVEVDSFFRAHIDIKGKANKYGEPKIITLPVYYEVYSGTIDYRSGNWIRLDPVDIIATLTSAREEAAWRRKHPKENQNACYIVRRYRHGRKVKTGKDD